MNAQKKKSAVLIAHGFTGSPYELQGLAEFLRSKKLFVSLPILPGHGTFPDDLIDHGPDSWMNALRAAYEELTNQYNEISIIGLSVGGSLALKLASEVSSASVITIDAPVRLKYQSVIKFILPILKLKGKDLIKTDRGFFANEQIPGYEQRCYNRIPILAFQKVMAFLEHEMNPSTFKKITSPILIIQSTGDTIVSPNSTKLVFDHLGSRKKEQVEWEDRFHLIVQGERKQELYRLIADWII
jgi:carboxylesterase